MEFEEGSGRSGSDIKGAYPVILSLSNDEYPSGTPWLSIRGFLVVLDKDCSVSESLIQLITGLKC
jgi:hypothetical protein